jgi:hypothetical protein
MTFEGALGLVRLMIDNGVPREQAISNPVIPGDLRERIQQDLERDLHKPDGNFGPDLIGYQANVPKD